MPLVPDPKNCDISVKRAIQGLSKKLGYTSSPVFNNINITNTITSATSVFSETCTVAAGLNVLRVTGLQTDSVALTGTLRGAYIDVSNGSTEATGTIRAMELKARTEAPGDTGNNVTVLEGLSISADSKDHSVTTMRAAEFILDGSTGGTITEAVGLRIANNLQANKATTSYGLQIYRDSFDYTADIQLSDGSVINKDGKWGIGTSSPGSKLHINSIADDDVTLLTLESDISNNTEYNQILFKVSGGKEYGAIRSYVGNTAGDSYMVFLTSTTSGGVLDRQVTIQHNGYTGFGTWWPGERIHVVGNAFITGGIELGHASDTTLTRASAGNLNIEGNLVYRAGGTDVPLTDGGTGASSAGAARTNLGLAIGTNVQAWDTQLDDLATITATAAGIDSHLGGHSDTVLWSEVDKTTSSIADITTKNHTDLTAGDGSDHSFIDQSVVIAGTPTFAGIIVADGGTIGQAAGPLLTFDDTNNFLEITGCKVGIGTATPLWNLEIVDGGTDTRPVFSISSYNDQFAYCAALVTNKSNTDTIGNYAETQDGDFLFEFIGLGVGSDENAFVSGAFMRIIQTGVASASRVPADITFWTSPGGVTSPIQRMTVDKDGAVTMASTLGVTGAITASNYTAAALLTACATNAGALDFSAASKTLTVENNTIVSQDYSSDASPTFANLSIGTGELTCGSVNRASGTLTLEIGGTAELSITSTATTFGGNLIIPGDGTIGQAAGPLLTFDDTNDYLEITGCKVGIGTNTPVGKLEIQQAQNTDAATFTNPHLKITDSATTNNGGTTAIALATSSVADNYGVSLAGVRYTTSGNPEFSIRLHSGTAAGAEVFRILTDGGILMPNLKSGTDQANAGAAASEIYHDTDDNSIKIGV